MANSQHRAKDLSLSRIGVASALAIALALGAMPGASLPALADSAKVQPVKHTEPKYPRGALARGIQGWVLVEFAVDSQGNVVAPKVVECTPPGVFDAAALAAVADWKYEATGAAKPSVQVRFEFKVRG